MTQLAEARKSTAAGLETFQYAFGVEASATIIDLKSAGDTALITLARAGNHEAFEILVHRHSQRILSIARRLTGHHEDAEDVLQQSLLKAFVHLQEFEGKSSFSTWLTRIALNEGLMLLRSRRRFPDVSIDTANDNEKNAVVLQLPHPGPSPEGAYMQAEQHATLSLAINRLGPNVRRAIQLNELNEMTARETARTLGVSISAVKSRILRGRKRMKETIEMYQRTAGRRAKANVQTIRRRTNAPSMPVEKVA